MIHNKETAHQLASHLLQIKAIKLQPNNPFTWASGWKSPIYCDNRKTLSYPTVRNFIRQNLTAIVREEFENVNVIVGVATGGIAHGVLIAQELGLPFAYVRSSAKEHGMQNMIEGEVTEGQKIVVVEDLVSTGKSSLNAVEALKEKNVNVLGMVSIFDYGFDIAQENFKKAKCKLISLSDYDHLIEKALKEKYIQKSEIESLSAWRIHPAEWKNNVQA